MYSFACLVLNVFVRTSSNNVGKYYNEAKTELMLTPENIDLMSNINLNPGLLSIVIDPLVTYDKFTKIKLPSSVKTIYFFQNYDNILVNNLLIQIEVIYFIKVVATITNLPLKKTYYIFGSGKCIGKIH